MPGKKRTLRTSVPTLRQIVVRFWPQIRRQRGLAAGGTAALIAEVLLRLLEPWPLKFIVDGLFVPEGSTGVAALDTLTPTQLLAVCAGIIVLVAVMRAGLLYARKVAFALAGSRILAQIRGELFSHLQRLSLNFHHQRRSGDLITRVTGDIGQVKEVAITAAMPLLAHMLTLTVMMVVMFVMDWRLALIALSIVPLFALTTRRIGSKIRTVARKQRRRKGQLGATAAEAMGAIKTVQSLSLESVHDETFSARNKSDLKEGVKAKRLMARLVGTVDVLIAIATAGILWWGALRVLDGALTLGQLLVFLTYLKIAVRPLHNTAKYAGRIAKAAASAERVLEILDATPLVTNRPGAVDAPLTIESVTFDNVQFRYDDDGALAINNLSLTLRTGEIVVIAGPSGAGKSTFANLLLRLYDPDAGAIRFNDHDLRDLTVESLRQRIAVVPQENVLFRVSAGANIAYGAPGATEEEVIAAAKIARAHKFISRLPQGYETTIGERGSTLSEGQRQRIAIARAAIRPASIVLLDEPTASLDSDNTRHVRSALHTLSNDRLCIVIAHDLTTVEDHHRVLYFEDGLVVEDGTHAELLAQGGKYATMFALQNPASPPDASPDAPVSRSHAIGG